MSYGKPELSLDLQADMLEAKMRGGFQLQETTLTCGCVVFTHRKRAWLVGGTRVYVPIVKHRKTGCKSQHEGEKLDGK